MGVSLVATAKSWRVLTVGIVGLALFAASGGIGSVRSASAAICGDDLEFPPTGSRTVSGCGGSGGEAYPASTNEIHFSSGTNRAEGVTEAPPPTNAQLGRSGRGASVASSVPAASAASVNALPPRKTIDLSKLPAGLVAPAK
ncbi:MAG: hypothetical protein ABI939_06765 [Anaerolineaceae bacterium]